MNMRHWLYWLLITSLTLTFRAAPVVQVQPVVVRAVLFYSPACGHCEKVITQDLPPLIEQYDQQLQIIAIDVTQPAGQALFQSAIQYFNLAQAGVPTLVVDKTVLVGSVEIPEKLPGLIEEYLAQGGTEWPAIPGLAEALNAQATPQPATAAAVPADKTPAPRLEPPVAENGTLATGPEAVNAWSSVVRDPIGNGLALIVLFGMVVSVAVILLPRRAPIARSQPAWREWMIPVLCIIGLVVAGYLAYIETAQVEAVCGPVGDCNTVQQSEYARLFGILPIGVLGLIGYAAIILAWWIERSGRAPLDRLAALGLVLMTVGGTLFSIYLTFLEPFVIGATCLWCLTSAILMTLLLLLTVTPRRWAFIRGRTD
jgi:uncharacterized membrane protein